VSTVAFAASVLASPAAQSRDGGHPVVVSFTKWATITPGYPILAGVTGGDAAGTFSGEVFVLQTTQSSDITRLDAVYEVHAGDHSFKALVQGGQNNVTNKALLDGVVLDGWMTGAHAHVAYQVIKCDQPNAAGGTCFQGTITLTPSPDN
jgi:hypothetical protein